MHQNKVSQLCAAYIRFKYEIEAKNVKILRRIELCEWVCLESKRQRKNKRMKTTNVFMRLDSFLIGFFIRVI